MLAKQPSTPCINTHASDGSLRNWMAASIINGVRSRYLNPRCLTWYADPPRSIGWQGVRYERAHTHSLLRLQIPFALTFQSHSITPRSLVDLEPPFCLRTVQLTHALYLPVKTLCWAVRLRRPMSFQSPALQLCHVLLGMRNSLHS